MLRIWFLVLCLLGPLQQSFAVTSTEGEFADTLYPFEYFWNICSDKVEIYVALPDRFEFGKQYETYKFGNGGLGCRIVCKPIPGYYYYSDSMMLKEMQISVELINSPFKEKHVLYKIIAEATYEENGWISKSIKSFNHEIDSGNFTPAEILLESKPAFFSEFGSCPVSSFRFEMN